MKRKIIQINNSTNINKQTIFKQCHSPQINEEVCQKLLFIIFMYMQCMQLQAETNITKIISNELFNIKDTNL